MGQYEVLQALKKSKRFMTAGDMVRHLNQSKQSVSVALKKLERSKFIKKKQIVVNKKNIIINSLLKRKCRMNAVFRANAYKFIS